MSVNSHPHTLRRKKTKAPAPIDRLVYLAVFIGPVMTLPQIYSIWVLRQRGVSLLSWAAYTLVAFIWVMYGLKHREKAVILVNFVWMVMDVLVVAGLLAMH